jgi:hypothetical protein
MWAAPTACLRHEKALGERKPTSDHGARKTQTTADTGVRCKVEDYKAYILSLLFAGPLAVVHMPSVELLDDLTAVRIVRFGLFDTFDRIRTAASLALQLNGEIATEAHRIGFVPHIRPRNPFLC